MNPIQQTQAAAHIELNFIHPRGDELTGDLMRQGKQNARPAGEGWSMSWLDFYCGCVSMFGGTGHGLLIGTIEGGGDVTVEILGPLPPALRKSLRQVRAWWEPVLRNRVPWCLVAITWCLRLDGWGPRFAIRDLGLLLDLVSERRLALEGTRV